MENHQLSNQILKISIISYHFSPNSEICNSRPLLIYKALKKWKKTASINIYFSAFEHINKVFVGSDNPDFIPLPVPPYSRNISLKRLYSYFIFAVKLLQKFPLKTHHLIIICVPPNFPLLTALLYKMIFKIPVVVDVVDLWPEALPLPPKLKKLTFPVTEFIMKPVRRLLYSQTNLITTQSNYFRHKLNLDASQCSVIYMSSVQQKSKHLTLSSDPSISQSIRILYLGSINNIIDLKSFITILEKLSHLRLIHLSVIGGGEKLDYLKEAVSKLNISTTFYGICFDSDIKEKEFSLAHFGYNGYVDNTEVALSYKSLEYFANSLPLLNSAKGDTYDLIDTEKCGLNFNPDDLDSLITSILNLDDQTYQQMRKQTANVFEQYFSWTIFRQKIQEKLQSFFP